MTPPAPLVSPYLRKVACKDCPFRRSRVGVVQPERAAEIAQHLLRGGRFTCHKTTVLAEDGETMVPGPHAQECAGALATLHLGGHSNQLGRIAQRLGMFDPEALDVERSDVFESLGDWVHAHWGDSGGLVHCEVVGPNCADPQGYAFAGNVTSSLDEPQCDPENCCTLCGHVMCTECERSENEYGEVNCLDCCSDDEE